MADGPIKIHEARMVGGDRGKPNRTYKKGRRCMILSCGTVLSIYNPTDFCALHSSRARALKTYE